MGQVNGNRENVAAYEPGSGSGSGPGNLKFCD